MQEELPDEAVYCIEVASRPTSKSWEMYFDGASKTDEKGRPKSGVGIVFITPEGNMIPHSFTRKLKHSLLSVDNDENQIEL